jgi:hypothetical protein
MAIRCPCSFYGPGGWPHQKSSSGFVPFRRRASVSAPMYHNRKEVESAANRDARTESPTGAGADSAADFLGQVVIAAPPEGCVV